MFELSTGATNAACGESNIILNGNELTQTWDGFNGAGSGAITAKLPNGHRSQELVASWQSLCVLPDSSKFLSTNDRPALVLTVRIHQADQEDKADQDLGFTISFRQLGEPEILRLDPSPLSIPDDNLSLSLELESWRDPDVSDRLRIQTVDPPYTGESLEESLEIEFEEFQELRFRAKELQQMIKAKEDKIRKLLQQDCSSFSSRVQKCESVGCVFQTCFKAVPEMINGLRCRFGSLDSCVSRKPSFGCGQEDFGPGNGPSDGLGDNNPGYSLDDYHHSDNMSHGIGSDTETSNNLFDDVDADSYSSHSPNPASPSSDDSFHLSRTYFVPFAIFIICFFILKRCIKICCNPRRRAEHAARREERRTRQAYLCAARRHRWRQWWSGNQPRSRDSSSYEGSNHDLENQGNETSRRQSISGASNIFEEGAMQAEILGLRRALEFVGELIQPDDMRYQNPPRRHPRSPYGRTGSPANRGALVAPPASSTAALTSINSPRTSSLMSCDTGSSVTLETLDLDPPEYQK